MPPPTKPVNRPIGILSTASNGGNPPEITTVSERAMNSMPSVVMKLGMANRSVMKPLMKPMAAQISRPIDDRDPERHVGVEHQRDAHRHEGEDRPDRQVELAADHQDREADRDQADFGQQPEHAAEVLEREEDAVRLDLEQDHAERPAGRRPQARLSRTSSFSSRRVLFVGRWPAGADTAGAKASALQHGRPQISEGPWPPSWRSRRPARARRGQGPC